MKVKGLNVLVTGANRGFGRALTEALLDAGAGRVHAAARDPATVTTRGVEPVELDVTNPAQVEAAARLCNDVDLVINNAGIAMMAPLLADDSLESLHRHLEVNAFGTLSVSRAFAPVLAARGGGALVNVLSVVSFFTSTALATYSVSKAAAWSITNGLRAELADQGTRVMGVHVGFMDTDLTAGLEVDKSDPALIAGQVIQALEEGRDELLADPLTRQVHAGLSASGYLREPTPGD